MELIQQSIDAGTTDAFSVRKKPDNQVVSLEECKRYLDKFNLNDQDISDIRNILTGIADKTINSYLDNFR